MQVLVSHWDKFETTYKCHFDDFEKWILSDEVALTRTQHLFSQKSFSQIFRRFLKRPLNLAPSSTGVSFVLNNLNQFLTNENFLDIPVLEIQYDTNVLNIFLTVGNGAHLRNRRHSYQSSRNLILLVQIVDPLPSTFHLRNILMLNFLTQIKQDREQFKFLSWNGKIVQTNNSITQLVLNQELLHILTEADLGLLQHPRWSTL